MDKICSLARTETNRTGFDYHKSIIKNLFPATITTFPIEELLGTKMRALYQRRKGRDLYDLYIALNTLKTLDTSKILHCLREYMKLGGHNISKKLFVDNMEAKMQHTGFCGDMSPLLPTGMKTFDPQEAYTYVLEALIQHV